jgi:putative ABC transport system permease protein
MRMSYLVRQSVKVRAFRTIVTVTCIAILIATLFTGTLIMNGVNRSVDLTQSRLGADIMVLPWGAKAEYENAIMSGQFYSDQTLLTGVPFGFYMEENILDVVKNVPGVDKCTVQIYTATLPGHTCPRCTLPNIFIVAFDPETDFTLSPWLKTKLNSTLGAHDMIVGSNIIDSRLIFVPEEQTLGYSFPVFGYELTIRGILGPTGTGADHTVFITVEGFRQMIAEAPYSHGAEIHKLPEVEINQISSVLIKLDSQESYSDVARDIIIRAEQEGIKVDVSQATELGQEVRQRMKNVLAGISMATGVLWGLSILFISSIFLLSVNERRREIGLLRSMGATRNFVFSMIMSEAVILTIIGGITGISIGFLVLRFFNDFVMNTLGVPYIWPSLTNILFLVIQSLGIAVATGMVAAFYPGARAGRMEPYESVRKGW